MMEIRKAEAGMLPELCRVERECFSSPWSEAAIRAEIDDENSIFLASGDENGLSGFVIVKAAADECEVYNLAVMPGCRRRGAARSLLGASLLQASERGAISAYLEVRESNEAAKRLYLSMGFEEIGLRRDYYDDPKENAVIMKKELH
ncbi:MAG: ribosomal protein S18-alanine N-acetyltransferase [Oscillospiraceae bacterium]|nr:ribosomal protein S18-alanine N-acetyltransferase [Oscillospiraceae bacterium]